MAKVCHAIYGRNIMLHVRISSQVSAVIPATLSMYRFLSIDRGLLCVYTLPSFLVLELRIVQTLHTFTSWHHRFQFKEIDLSTGRLFAGPANRS